MPAGPRTLLAALVSSGAIITLMHTAAEAAPATCSNRVFCAGWRYVCNNRSSARSAECERRFDACLSSGCYFFNVPRPRCKNSAEDLALTTSCQRAR
jgi:hypothetical protein